MNKKPDQGNKNLEKNAKRLGSWLRVVGVLYRLLIIAGLILLLLAISAVFFTSMFNLGILVLPVLLIILGIILAWLEFQLHDRYYAQQSKDLDREGEQEQGHGHP